MNTSNWISVDKLSRAAGLISRLRSHDVTTAEGRAIERHRRVALSAAASIFARSVSIGTALLSVPLTLHYLGSERYGMWMVMSSLVAFINFADLGIGNGVLTLIATVSGKDDDNALRSITSSGVFALSLISGAMLVIFAIFYQLLDWNVFFNVRSSLAQSEAGPAFAVFFCSVAMAIPLGVVQKLQAGLQQAYLVSAWQSCGSVLGLAGVLIAIQFRSGLPWLVFAFATVPVLATLLNNIVFFWLARPDLRPRFALVNLAIMKRIAYTGGFFFLIQISGALIFATDPILITRELGAAAVADYAVPEKLFGLVPTLISMLAAPLWPAYGEAITRGDHAWVRCTFFRSLAAAGLVATAISIILVSGAPYILPLWIGQDIAPPFALLLGFGIWKVMEALGAAIAAFQNGAQQIGFQAITATMTAAVAVVLKILFLKYFGVYGVVWATIAAYGSCSLLPTAWYMSRRFSFLRSSSR